MKGTKITKTKKPMKGGNIMNSVSHLAVPAALMLARKMLNDYKPIKKILTGGNSDSYGGVASQILQDPVIDNYLKMNKISRVFPNTLMPLGLLQDSIQANYNLHQNGDRFTQQQLTTTQEESIISQKNLDRYKKKAGLSHLTNQSLVPFALVVGQKTFDNFLKTYN